jgi:hypothetical protein
VSAVATIAVSDRARLFERRASDNEDVLTELVLEVNLNRVSLNRSFHFFFPFRGVFR